MVPEVVTDDLLPVSLLCGFLGAGKTTLLKHVLETKHSEEGFKCAVIVNDMAALNIDKRLIDQTALVQSDEVIAMENGCFCCTLQSDLVDQIVELANKKIFNYILIEASGVSEPSQIAPLFELCDDEHDHEEEHTEGPQLGEVARLDTCVTVVDAADFYNNLESMKVYEQNEVEGTITELMMEQVEFSNVVVLNKKDLVNEDQLSDILARIALINPRAKVLKSKQSKIDVMEILNTKMFSREHMEEGSVMVSATKVEAPEKEELPSCCIVSLDDGKKRCCKSKNKNLIDSGLSQVLLGVVADQNKKPTKSQMTRHEKRFGITSFVYRARRPFHPGRLYNNFLDPYFMNQFEEFDGPELRSHLDKEQKLAALKQPKRIELMGELLRSKGFIWIATSNFLMGGFQQAGNILRIEAQGPWMCENAEQWEGTPNEALIYKDMVNVDGVEYPYMDRRQELVFIGHRLKHEAIQKALDNCLLTDEEFNLGPGKWEENWAKLDNIQMGWDVDVDDSDDDEEDEEEDEQEEGPPTKNSKRDQNSNGEKANPVKNGKKAPISTNVK